ncbi:MAG: hypothetical protein JJE10_08215 [Thermoleophilia bacterium]|nr:hypothetical protein [Thermoleophilia bacterium]
MNPRLIKILVCPHCGGALRENAGALICSAGHTANIARQGYVSLLGRDSGTHTADSAEMIAARERFLASGHFDPLAAAVSGEVGRALDDLPDGAIVDLGSGTGYYLAAVLGACGSGAGDASRIGLGIDNSKFAARRSARCHPDAGAIVADIWDELPVATGSAAIVLDIFAPRNGEEIRRILTPGGILIVVTPTARHLGELIGPLEMISVDTDKELRLEKTLGDLAEGMEISEFEWEVDLGREAVRDVVGMGPSAGRTDPGRFEKALNQLPDPVKVTGSVRIGRSRRR